MAVTPDGTRYLSTGEDRTVRVWDAAKLVELDFAVVVRAKHAGITSDLDSAEDALGIADDTRMMAAILTTSAITPPLSIALLGDWGTGKSSLMRQIQLQVDLISATAPGVRCRCGRKYRPGSFQRVALQRRPPLGRSCGASFHGLQQSQQTIGGGAPQSDATTVKAELATAEKVHAAIGRQLNDIEGLERSGILAWLTSPIRTLKIFSTALRSSPGALRRAGLAPTVIALLFVAGAIALTVWSDRGWPGISLAVLGVIVTSWTYTRTIYGRVKAGATKIEDVGVELRRRLIEEKQAAQKEVEDAKEKLDEIDPGRRLDRLLTEIGSTNRYECYRGLVGRIRDDLDRLSEDLTKAQDAWSASVVSAGEPPLQRIILYIDDLDRCAPDRVVRVFQAINLLLSFRLFLVVVAVDPRWILGALTTHHREVFPEAEIVESAGTGTTRRSVEPVDFLDKIFHIPFALRPAKPSATDYLVSLFPEVDGAGAPPPIADSSGPEVRSDPATDPPADTTQGDAPSDSTDSQPPAPAQRPTDRNSEAPEAISPPPVEPESVAQPPTPERRGRVPVTAVEPEALLLTRDEVAYLGRLAPLMSSPRAIKKLANLYRLLRLSISSARLPDWLEGATPHPYQAAAMLLATVTEVPSESRALLVAILDSSNASRSPGFPDAGSRSATPRAATKLATLIAAAEPDADPISYRDLCREWARAIARYGFQTYDLFEAHPHQR